MYEFSKDQSKLASTIAVELEKSGCNVGESIQVLTVHLAGLLGRHAPNVVEIERFGAVLGRKSLAAPLSCITSRTSSRESEIDMPNPFHVTYLLPPAFERLVESLREIAIASARAKAIMERISAPQGLLITLDEMPKNEAWRQLERECRPTCDLCCHYQAHPP